MRGRLPGFHAAAAETAPSGRRGAGGTVPPVHGSVLELFSHRGAVGAQVFVKYVLVLMSQEGSCCVTEGFI